MNTKQWSHKYRIHRVCALCKHYQDGETPQCHKHHMDISPYGKCAYDFSLDQDKLKSKVGDMSEWLKE